MKKITVLFLFCFTCCIVTKNNPILLLANEPNSIHWGVNIHDGGNNPQGIATELEYRNLKYTRMDLWGNDSRCLAKFLNAVELLNAKNIKTEAIVYTIFSKDQARSMDYTANLSEVEQTAYNETRSQIVNTKDYISDYELQNEIPLYPNIKVSGSSGQIPSDYEVPAGRLQAAVLRGMSKAIDDVRKQYNKPIRIILGTVDRQFGFLTYMRQQGVLFDVIGYHIYPWEMNEPLDEDTWFGQGGALGQLAKFNMPVHINEFNAGEIYSGGPNHPGPNYENQAGMSLTEDGFKSLYKHLNEIVNQKIANIEAIHFYEMCDEPYKAVPENRFGLYYDTNLQLPKVSLLIATAFSGGKLSEAEKAMLSQRNFTYYNVVSGLVGNNSTDSKVSIYPNPTWNIINIDTETKFEHVNIFNNQGLKVLSCQLNEFERKKSIDISSFTPGVYFMVLTSKQSKHIARIIKL